MTNNPREHQKRTKKSYFIDWYFLGFDRVYISLPSSMADLVPRDAFLQKARWTAELVYFGSRNISEFIQITFNECLQKDFFW